MTPGPETHAFPPPADIFIYLRLIFQLIQLPLQFVLIILSNHITFQILPKSRPPAISETSPYPTILGLFGTF